MKKFKYAALLTLLWNGILIADTIPNVDPEWEDTNLQQEQTHDFQFQEDKDLRQEQEMEAMPPNALVTFCPLLLEDPNQEGIAKLEA